LPPPEPGPDLGKQHGTAKIAADEKRKASRGAPGDLQIHIDAARRAERALFEELDERFLDMTPHDVAHHAPHQGDPAQVRERRRRHGRRAIDGRMALTAEQRAEYEAWLRETGASVREIARYLDCSTRRAHTLWQEWHHPDAEAA
jgi:hypothetical protein